MRDFRGLLPICRNQVAPWLDSLTPDFVDRPSFRHMIELAERDRDGLAKLRPDFVHALPQDLDDLDADILAADALIEELRARLLKIESAT